MVSEALSNACATRETVPEETFGDTDKWTMLVESKLGKVYRVRAEIPGISR